MADPVASKSGFLCMYMSNHPDTLVGYVKHWGKVAEDVSSAKMISIDTKGMTLAYKTKAGGPEKEVRVLFDPPLLGYEEVKPRLISMKVDAEEALGMARAPQITTFRLPFGIWTTNVLLAFLLYVTFSPEPQSPNFAPAYLPAHYARTNLPVWAVTASWWIVVIVHPLEALYALYMARRHRMPFTTGVGYVLGTLIWGLPVLNELRHQRQAARIEIPCVWEDCFGRNNPGAPLIADKGIARALEIERQLNAGEGRTVEELIKSDDPLKGVEAARLRRWFSSNKMIPLRDLTDDFGSAVLFGRLEVVQADILARMHKHAQRSTPDPRAAVVRDIYEMRWGPTQVPIFNLILLSTLLVPAMRPQQLAVARFLINEMKMPVDGRDLSGATGLYHAISTKPAFDPEYAQILVDAGGDVNARNRYGDTTAAEIAMLRDYGADGKQRARDALAWFFAHGGNVDVMNTDGVSARWVMATAHQQMVQVTGVMRALAQLPMWDVVLQEDERRKALGMKACAFCARVKEEGSGKALLLCSRCKCVTYCAPPRKCQMDDWRHHKGRCKPNKASRGSTYLGVPLDS
ncbi:uncharacterized protein C8Q71DRAFT_846309 [Rhodofomes roseus]|uniref:MYND-type domain-containing protein n=1 Tax=Rhodofomes roseus TaxID=34475 RepID=A0ABQ8KTH6_9APHY|nr:uncharacterized protein C8Q71DRAFT_846309 [Rhodofomes roseus]KAH9841136.1 hypothetical protein C8Q71DRAFT_846309 [Rhodofomes roseus]